MFDFCEAADGINTEARNEEISRMPSRQNSGIKQKSLTRTRRMVLWNLLMYEDISITLWTQKGYAKTSDALSSPLFLYSPVLLH
jgi:hypothetical protein